MYHVLATIYICVNSNVAVYNQLLHLSSASVMLTIYHQCSVAQTSAPARRAMLTTGIDDERYLIADRGYSIVATVPTAIGLPNCLTQECWPSVNLHAN